MFNTPSTKSLNLFSRRKKKKQVQVLVFFAVRHAWKKPNPNTDIRCWSESSEWPSKQPQNLERHLQTITQKEKRSALWLHHTLWDYNSDWGCVGLPVCGQLRLWTQSTPKAKYHQPQHRDLTLQPERTGIDWYMRHCIIMAVKTKTRTC